MGALGSGALGMTGSFTVWGAQFSVAADGIAFVGFDPYSLAISIAIYFIMQMMQCEDDEQALAMKRGQGLCHKVGSYCASKVLGACVTKKEGWCCFPSKLGRIVNEQGRAQIGKGWGDAEDPDCSGFTAEQLALLKFDEMDLSEFIADIVPSTKTSNYAIDRLSTQAASYYATP
jgi:conjugal transfer mating pair stabilization protein TraN